jgi:drug/metabolite transporter (DMT)-like permease
MMQARILIILTVIFWGWTFVATKVCLEYISPVELIGFRLLIALPIMHGIILLKKIKLRFGNHYKKLFLGSFIIAGHFLIQITGIKYTSATNTGWIIALIPLVTAVLAYLILKEYIGKNVIIGIIVATIGILLLISRGSLFHFGWLSSVGDWLVLGSAHTWALYTIVTRDISRAFNPLAVTFMILLPSAALFPVIMIFFSDWSTLVELPAKAIVGLLYLGIFGTALAHWFWQVGIAHIGAARAGMYLYIEPLATTALAVPYLNETFGWYTGTGGALVLLGVWYAQHLSGRYNIINKNMPISDK